MIHNENKGNVTEKINIHKIKAIDTDQEVNNITYINRAMLGYETKTIDITDTVKRNHKVMPKDSCEKRSIMKSCCKATTNSNFRKPL